MSHSRKIRLQDKLVGLVLAAGASTRLGFPKQLIVYRQQTLIERAVTLAAEFCGAGVIVVTGFYHEEVAGALAGTNAKTVHNPQWKEGMSSSLRVGMLHLDPMCHGVMLMLCDQPSIDAADYLALTNAWMSDPDCIVAAEYAGTKGAPAIFPASFRDDLTKLTGDQGAKKIIANAERVRFIHMPNAEIDIDTPEDLGDLEDPN